MKPFGKTIRLFLVDGTANGLISAELSNWTGLGTKLPKIKIKDFKDRPEFQKQGVYILLGRSENNDAKAYIGEAESIYLRLVNHLQSDFWYEVIFFTSKDDNLNKAGVKYLEHRLHEIAISANRYKINQNIPNRPKLSEPEQAELEEFLGNIKVLTATLGHPIFESLQETTDNVSVQRVFFCKNGAGANASGTPSTEGFVVFAGAELMKTEQKSLAPSVSKERQQMLEAGTLVDNGLFYKLTKDYLFSSSSRAVDAVFASSASGPVNWKTAEGVQLKTIETEFLK